MKEITREYWNGHALVPELIRAMEELAARVSKPAAFYNLYMVLLGAYHEGLLVVQHIDDEGNDLFEVWDPETDEVAGPMTAPCLCTLMQGFGMCKIRKRGPRDGTSEAT